MALQRMTRRQVQVLINSLLEDNDEGLISAKDTRDVTGAILNSALFPGDPEIPKIPETPVNPSTPVSAVVFREVDSKVRPFNRIFQQNWNRTTLEFDKDPAQGGWYALRFSKSTNSRLQDLPIDLVFFNSFDIALNLVWPQIGHLNSQAGFGVVDVNERLKIGATPWSDAQPSYLCLSWASTYSAATEALVTLYEVTGAGSDDSSGGGITLPEFLQRDTRTLHSRAGVLFWEGINEVPDTPGTSSAIGSVLTVTGENDQDYAWKHPVAGPSQGGLTPEQAADILANTAAARANRLAIAENRMSLAESDTDRNTVLGIAPDFIAGEDTARNLVVSVRQPADAYPDANTAAIVISGFVTKEVAYNPGITFQQLTFPLTAADLDTLTNNGRLTAGTFIDVEVRFQTGARASGNAIKFSRVVDVPVITPVGIGPQGRPGPSSPYFNTTGQSPVAVVTVDYSRGTAAVPTGNPRAWPYLAQMFPAFNLPAARYPASRLWVAVITGASDEGLPDGTTLGVFSPNLLFDTAVPVPAASVNAAVKFRSYIEHRAALTSADDDEHAIFIGAGGPGRLCYMRVVGYNPGSSRDRKEVLSFYQVRA